MLDIAVHDSFFVDVLESYGDLGEDVQSVRLRKTIKALSLLISTQVSSIFIFGDDIVGVVNDEVVKDAKHVLTRLAFGLSIDL